MFRYWDLSHSLYWHPGFETHCPIHGCTMSPTCVTLASRPCGILITCLGSCHPCTAESMAPCTNQMTGAPFGEVTEQVIGEMTDAVDLAALQSELERLSEAAAERRDEILNFIRRPDDDEDDD